MRKTNAARSGTPHRETAEETRDHAAPKQDAATRHLRAARPINDVDPFIGPPIHAKTSPSREMGDAALALDDERRAYPHHPNDNAVTDFDYEPEAADAAADLAGELGAQFLEGATRAEDLSERVAIADARDEENDVPFLIEAEAPEAVVVPEGGDEDIDDEAPTLRIKKRTSR